jgi:hypothetical protein
MCLRERRIGLALAPPNHPEGADDSVAADEEGNRRNCSGDGRRQVGIRNLNASEIEHGDNQGAAADAGGTADYCVWIIGGSFIHGVLLFEDQYDDDKHDKDSYKDGGGTHEIRERLLHIPSGL